MIDTKLDRKNTLRRFLNENRTSLERDVDELIDELWRLKRRISRSYKDTHYDVQRLIDDLEWTICVSGGLIQRDWKHKLGKYLKSCELSTVETTNDEGVTTPTKIFTLDYF